MLKSGKPHRSNAKSTPQNTTPTLYVVATSHLDTQWRWTYQDTIGEFLPRTLTENFEL